MTNQDISTLRLIKLTYSGAELEAMLKAWETFPTLKTDCLNERRIKEQLRKARMKKYLLCNSEK